MNKSLISALLLSVMAVGCSDRDDIHRYITEVRARPAAAIDPLPIVQPFVAMSYQAADARNPFSTPQPEVAFTERTNQKVDCQLPQRTVPKEPLEQYALENLRFTGSIGDKGRLFALIAAPTGEVHRVGLNNYLGLNNGKVVGVAPTRIDLEEVIMDGKGCWVKRLTQLVLDAGR